MSGDLKYDRIDRETLIFTIHIPQAIRLLDKEPHLDDVRDAVPFIFSSARHRAMNVFELASSEQSLGLLPHPKKNSTEHHLSLSHVILCLVAAFYKFDLLERAGRDPLEHDLEPPPTTEEAVASLRWEIYGLLRKIIKLHSEMVKMYDLIQLINKVSSHRSSIASAVSADEEVPPVLMTPPSKVSTVPPQPS